MTAPAELPDPVALLASTLKLMTSYAATGCPKQIALIRRQLGIVRNYPDCQMPPLLKEVAARLEAQWGQVSFSRLDAPAVEKERPLLH